MADHLNGIYHYTLGILTRIKICGFWSNKEKGFETPSPQPHPPRRDFTKLHARQYNIAAGVTVSLI